MTTEQAHEKVEAPQPSHDTALPRRTWMSAMLARRSGSTWIIFASRSFTSADSGTRSGNANWPVEGHPRRSQPALYTLHSLLYEPHIVSRVLRML